MIFDIRDAISFEPVRILADPNSIFEPGMIGQLYEIEDTIVCGLSDGTRPFGILSDYKLTKYECLDFNDLIRIYPQRSVFRTDRFQLNTENDYISGAALYVNEVGFLTVDKPREEAHIVGRLITPSNEKNSWMEALWF